MGQHADLGGNLPVLLDLLEPPQDLPHLLRGVGDRVQADHCVTGTEAETLQHRGGDAVRVVGGVVGLQPAAQGSGQTDGGVAVGGDGDLRCRVNQIQIAHQLTDRRDHLGGQSPAGLADSIGSGGLIQQPLPKLPHGLAFELLISGDVQVILNDPGDLIFLVRHRRVLPQFFQSHLGQNYLGRHSLLSGFGGKARKLVAGLFLVGLGQHLLDRGELICFPK